MKTNSELRMLATWKTDSNLEGKSKFCMQAKKHKSACIYLALFITFFICRATSCKRSSNCPEGSHDQMFIQNNSAIAINWIWEDSQDTIWTNNGTFSDEDRFLILPGSSGFSNPGLSQCWENYFLEGRPRYYFIFSHDTVKAIGWQQISGTNRGLLKKVKVDLEYLKNNNFTIAYP